MAAVDMGNTENYQKKAGPSFREAYAKHRAAWAAGKGSPTFSWNGGEYSVATREEAARNKAMRESPDRGRGMNRAEAPSNTRADAAKSMADRADLEAKQRRAASEARAKQARESANEIKREARGQVRQAESTSGMGSKITNRPAPGARSIYENAFADGGLVKARGSAKSHGKAC